MGTATRARSVVAAVAVAVGAVCVTPAAPASADVGTDTLRQGESLTDARGSGQFLRSRSGQHVLQWEVEAGVEFLGVSFGSSLVSGFGVGPYDDEGLQRLVLQRDGNLVAYAPTGEVLFASGTFTAEPVRLVLQDDGNLVLYTQSDRVLWATGGTPSVMEAFLPWEGSVSGPTGLLPGHYLLSSDRRSRLVMQGDGNLVLYGRDGRARFATATFGGSDSVAVLQTDGNLVVYDGGRAVWATGTHRRVSAPVDSFALVLQDDGDAVLYDSGIRAPEGRAVWSSRRGRLG